MSSKLIGIKLKKIKFKSRFFITAFLIILFGILIPTAEGFSQNILIINSDVGGGSGSTTPQTESGSGNSGLYIVGGLLIGGIVIYALLKKNKDKSDTTDTKDKSSLLIQDNKFESFNTKLQKAKNDIPVDLILGVRNEKAFISEKTYLLGVSVRF